MNKKHFFGETKTQAKNVIYETLPRRARVQGDIFQIGVENNEASGMEANASGIYQFITHVTWSND